MQLATQISTSDLSEDAKQSNIDNLFSMLEAGLSLNKDFAGLGLDTAFTPSSESSGLLNQLSSGTSSAALAENGDNTPGNSSALTGNELGQPNLNPNVTNTLSGTISTTAADKLKEAYNIDPTLLFGTDTIMQAILAYGKSGLQQAGAYLDSATASRYAQIDWDAVSKKFKEGIANNTIYQVPVRDPNYGVLLDPAFAEFDSPYIYYDPDNVLGLRV